MHCDDCKIDFLLESILHCTFISIEVPGISSVCEFREREREDAVGSYKKLLYQCFVCLYIYVNAGRYASLRVTVTVESLSSTSVITSQHLRRAM